MEHIFHYIILILEYNLLPIVLFILVFVSKHKSYRADEPISDKDKIIADAYEFVLIEAFANFSLLLRIYSDTTHDFAYHEKTTLIVVTCITMLCMLVLFAFGWVKNGKPIAKEVSDFQYASYFCFFSWWLRVSVLGVYSAFLYDPYGIGVAAVFFVASFYLVYRFINKYFIQWTVLFREMTNWIRSGNSMNAFRKGKQILKRFSMQDGEEFVIALAETSAELGTMYLMQNDPPQENRSYVINLLRKFLDHSSSSHLNKNTHCLIMASLYCKMGQSHTAIKVIEKYLTKHLQPVYIAHIYNNRHDLLD